jgi:hypothetical protein
MLLRGLKEVDEVNLHKSFLLLEIYNYKSALKYSTIGEGELKHAIGYI